MRLFRHEWKCNWFLQLPVAFKPYVQSVQSERMTGKPVHLDPLHHKSLSNMCK
jgi:hypothetical protein